MGAENIKIRPTITDMGPMSTEVEAEQIQVYRAHERFARGLDTNCQTNWVLRGTEFVRQSENSHRIGKGITKGRADELLKHRDLIVFEEVQNPILCFACKERTLPGKFFTISWFSWVGKTGEKSIEQLTFFLHRMTKEQAEQIPQELLTRPEFLPDLLDKDTVSIKENIDLLIKGDNWFLKTFQGILTTEQKKNPQNKILLKQTKDLEDKRDLVHSGRFKEFETRPKIIWVMVDGRKEARIADFDHIKQCWVWRRETTNDPEVLASIIKKEDMITQNWTPGQAMVLRSGIGLSARTAGKLQQENMLEAPPDLDALQNSFIDGNGNMREVSSFVPRIPENEIYKNGPVDVTPEYYSLESDFQPIIPPFFPIAPPPIMPGGGSVSILPITPQLQSERPNHRSEIPSEIFAAALFAPATFGFLGETINHLPLADLTEQDGLTLENKSSSKDAGNIGVEPSREAEGLDDYRILEVSEEPDFLSDTSIFPERDNFFPEPPKDDGNGGGGGRILPQKFESGFVPHQEWNSLDRIENHGEQVVFDVSQKKEQKPEREVIFHQYAADLEVVQAETVEDMELLEQESNTPLLLVGVQNTPVEEDKEVNKKDLETENVYEEPELQETIHHNTAQYHSEDDVKDELPDQITEEVVPVEQAQEKHEQPNNFFIPTALLTSYLLWREMFGHNQISGINIGVKPSANNREVVNNRKADNAEENITQDNSFVAKTEQYKTQPKRVKVRAKITNTAFLSLLLLTKVKLLKALRMMTKKTRAAQIKQLFVTDTMLLFLMNPKLFLVKNYFWQNKDKTVIPKILQFATFK